MANNNLMSPDDCGNIQCHTKVMTGINSKISSTKCEEYRNVFWTELAKKLDKKWVYLVIISLLTVVGGTAFNVVHSVKSAPLRFVSNEKYDKQKDRIAAIESDNKLKEQRLKVLEKDIEVLKISQKETKEAVDQGNREANGKLNKILEKLN